MAWLIVASYLVMLVAVELVGRWLERREAARHTRLLAAIEEQRRAMAAAYWARQRAAMDAFMVDLLLSESGTTATANDTESYI